MSCFYNLLIGNSINVQKDLMPSYFWFLELLNYKVSLVNKFLIDFKCINSI